MNVQGRDCSIGVKTTHREIDIPYAEETIREAMSLLQEEASIEGDGICRATRKSAGAAGCVVTPLTITTTPILFYLAMGSEGFPVFVSETRNLYQYCLELVTTEETDSFDLIQDRGGVANGIGIRRLYESCRVKGFELRILREESIKLKLDFCGERSPTVYPYFDTFSRERGERFNGDNVTYRINGKEYKNIYGITLNVKKQGGLKTEIWIRRVLERGEEIPEIIEEIAIEAKLQRNKYENRYFGTFRITARRLFMTANETSIECDDAVIGPVRYYVSGEVTAEVFSSGGEAIA